MGNAEMHHETKDVAVHFRLTRAEYDALARRAGTHESVAQYVRRVAVEMTKNDAAAWDDHERQQALRDAARSGVAHYAVQTSKGIEVYHLAGAPGTGV